MPQRTKRLGPALVTAALLLVASWAMGQTSGVREDFTAIAIVNSDLRSGAGTVLFSVTRWSTDAERSRLIDALMESGSKALLEELRKNRSTGTMRTPDSLGYDLRFAHQTPGKDGGRRIVLATDRPIGFWEARNQPRTIDYPFTVIQMEFGADGRGKGTLSYATRIIGRDNVIELENFETSPVMLTEITSRKAGN